MTKASDEPVPVVDCERLDQSNSGRLSGGEVATFLCASASLQTQACSHKWALKDTRYLRCRILFADFCGRPNS